MTTRARGATGVLSRFANFAGIKPKAEESVTTTDETEEVKDDVEETKQDIEDLEDRIDDLEDDAEVDPDEPGDDKPEMKAAYRKGRATGRAAERKRAGAILASAPAAKNRNLALHLAFETGTPAKQAVETLRASAAGAPAPVAPKAPAASALDRRMAGTTRPAVGAAAPAGPDMNTAEGASSFVLAAARKAGFIKGA